jgi:MerR family transcriptional regulator, copper efflux regulator
MFRKVGASVMTEVPLRIGEIASRAGVSRRTVDFYTGLGLLTPVRRSGGNFRLYQPSDVKRIAAIRRLEAQGIRLDEITHLLTASAPEDHTECPDSAEGSCPADPVALKGYLTSLDAQVRALRDLPELADHGTRGVLTTLVARAQVLMATALIVSEEILPGAHLLPPL